MKSDGKELSLQSLWVTREPDPGGSGPDRHEAVLSDWMCWWVVSHGSDNNLRVPRG